MTRILLSPVQNCDLCDPGFVCFPSPLDVATASASGHGYRDLSNLLPEARRVLCLYCGCPPAFHTLLQEATGRQDEEEEDEPQPPFRQVVLLVRMAFWG